MSKAIFILLALAAVQASATTVQNCGGKRDLDKTSVVIEDCPETPCQLRWSGLVRYSVRFRPGWRMGDGGDLKVYIKAGNWLLSLPLQNGAPACGKFFLASDNSPAPCPLLPGVDYIFRDTFRVPAWLPASQGIVTAHLQHGSTIVKCYEFPVKVT